jgi:hypothetical protein
MADQQKQQDQQTQQASGNEQREQRTTPAQRGQDSRSESLLPAGDGANSKDGDDGRFEVAEEVNLDQQSDATRRVGQAPESHATDAVADTLRKP